MARNKEKLVEAIGDSIASLLDDLSRKRCPNCDLTHTLQVEMFPHSGVLIHCEALANNEDNTCGWKRVFMLTQERELPKPQDTQVPDPTE